MSVLPEAEVQKRLPELPGWKLVDGALEKKWKFGSQFLDGIEFVNDVAEIAEEMNHHPDIGIHWTEVTLRIWTHDEGGITERDVELARTIEKEIG
ncbi:MAG TPA: 4a-hydroxytetrahydrobiopterin dehydratase [Candidatus Thermoplasmatota archaeon]|nr:4a-hydroxytetrahydrobiopterin dehydratase [Candidatus Thermoplasmatota archaeon]